MESEHDKFNLEVAELNVQNKMSNKLVSQNIQEVIILQKEVGRFELLIKEDLKDKDEDFQKMYRK
jgi:hypothetical protein